MARRTPLTKEQWIEVADGIRSVKVALSSVLWKINGHVRCPVADGVCKETYRLNQLAYALEMECKHQIGWPDSEHVFVRSLEHWKEDYA